MDPFHTESVGSFWNILYSVFNDWVPYLPLMVISLALLALFPFFSKCKKNSFLLLSIFIFPIVFLYLYCKLLNVKHFITSRYFINFLPLFIITLYLSLSTIEIKLIRFKKYLRFGPLFLTLFIASNLTILPFYYRSEKQDFRGLAYYLKKHLQEGDKIFVGSAGYIPGILHYMGIHPEGRHHWARTLMEGNEVTHVEKPLILKNKTFILYHSKTCCTQYVADGSRLWIVVSKWGAKKIKEESPCVLKGYFDGSFLNFNRFPDEASFYLFLWDPKSQEEKGIDMPIE
jgi:hypothetical protein